MKPEILQIAPMLPRVEAALDAAYVVHRYWEAADGAALLARTAPGIRGVATDGHYGIAPEILDGAAGARDRGELRRGLRRDRYRRLQGARGAGDQHAGRAERCGGGAGARADDRALPAHPAGGRACARRALAAGRLRADRRADRGACRASSGSGGSARRSRGGCRRCGCGCRITGGTSKPYQPYAYYRRPGGMARDVDWLVVVAPGSAATRGIVSREVLRGAGAGGGAGQRRARLADRRGGDGRAAGATAGSAGRRSTSSRTSRGCRRRCCRMPNVVLSPHQGSATRRPAPPWGTWWSRNLAAHFAGDPLLTPVV